MSKTKHDQEEGKIEEIGSLLKKEREVKGFSVLDVANQLNLGEGMLHALERGDFAALPDPVFIQGYLRSYAKILNIDAQPLIKSYQAGLPKQEHDSLVQLTIKREVHSGQGVAKIISWAIGLGLVTILGLWWNSQSEQNLTTDEVVSESIVAPPQKPLLPEFSEPEKELAEELPLVESEVTDQPIEEPVEEFVSLEEVEPLLPAEPVVEAVEQERAVEVIDETPASDAEWDIVFSFSGPCWVSVQDAYGRVRLMGNKAAGERSTLEGPAPYRVILGDSSVVELQIDGKLIDLKPYSKLNVARFTLNPAELLKQ